MLPQAGQQSYYGRGKAGLGAVSAGLYGVRFGSLIICIPYSDLTADLLSFSFPASVPPGRFTRTVNGLVMRFSGLVRSSIRIDLCNPYWTLDLYLSLVMSPQLVQ